MLQSANRFPNSNYWTETYSNGKGIYISCFQLDPFIYDRSLLGVGFLQPLEMPIDWRSASPCLESHLLHRAKKGEGPSQLADRDAAARAHGRNELAAVLYTAAAEDTGIRKRQFSETGAWSSSPRGRKLLLAAGCSRVAELGGSGIVYMLLRASLHGPAAQGVVVIT